MEVREGLRGALAILKSDSVRLTAVFGVVALLMTLAAAGILSGLGLFLLMMLEASVFGVVGSAILLSVSLTVFLAGYLWISP